jgi:hypothetical protein
MPKPEVRMFPSLYPLSQIKSWYWQKERNGRPRKKYKIAQPFFIKKLEAAGASPAAGLGNNFISL